MRNLLALLAAALLAFVGVGWYLGWYKIERTTAPAGKTAYNVEVDTSKISTDVHRGGEKIQEALDSNKKEEGVKQGDSSKPDATKAGPNQ
jgi:hypothetical protein